MECFFSTLASHSLVACLDGHQMAKKGRAGPALCIAAIGSYIAGTIAVVGLMLLAPFLAEAALQFSSQEYFALYVFGRSEGAEAVLGQTRSGGACVNDTMLHLTVPGLPFGGVGASGMGAYHGRAGFDTFSHRRSVLRRGTWIDPALRYPPYGEHKQKMLRKLM